MRQPPLQSSIASTSAFARCVTSTAPRFFVVERRIYSDGRQFRLFSPGSRICRLLFRALCCFVYNSVELFLLNRTLFIYPRLCPSSSWRFDGRQQVVKLSPKTERSSSLYKPRPTSQTFDTQQKQSMFAPTQVTARWFLFLPIIWYGSMSIGLKRVPPPRARRWCRKPVKQWCVIDNGTTCWTRSVARGSAGETFHCAGTELASNLLPLPRWRFHFSAWVIRWW